MNPNARDAVYTPPDLAAILASFLPDDICGKILDPAAGEGALLEAVANRFGDRVYPVAIDHDPRAVSLLRGNKRWTVSEADSLSARSRAASAAWRSALKDLQAVVLNPPFSSRGGSGSIVKFDGFEGRVAPSVHFVAVVLGELQPARGLWAILPDGALDAQRHGEFWRCVRIRYDIYRLRRFDHKAFPGVRVSTSLVQIVPRDSSKSMPPPEGSAGVVESQGAVMSAACRCVEIVRGRVPVHRLSSESDADPVCFVHSTDLSRLREKSGGRLASGRLSDRAPLVMFARVGSWSPPVSLEIGRVVLSDCVIALRPRERGLLGELLTSVTGASAIFRGKYRGTGAKYITLASVVEVLGHLGWYPVVVKASLATSPCDGRCGARASHPSDSPGRENLLAEAMLAPRL